MMAGGKNEKKALGYIALFLLTYAAILAVDELLESSSGRRGLSHETRSRPKRSLAYSKVDTYDWHLDTELTNGKSWGDATILQDGTYLLFSDEHGFGNQCETLSKQKDVIKRIHYHAGSCKEFDGNFGNRLGTVYGMKMAAYALGVPFYFTCDTSGQEANGAAFLMELNSGEVAAPPKDRYGPLSVEKVCSMCHGKFCTWHMGELYKAAEIMTSDWKKLSDLVSIDHDDAVIHLRLGDALVAKNGRNEFKGVFPHQTYIDLIKKAQAQSGEIRSIGVVTAPFKGSFVRSRYDVGTTDKSEMVAMEVMDALQKAFPMAKIRLLNSPKATILESLVRLAQAEKISICGCSTFCPYPLMASKGSAYVYEPNNNQNGWVKNAAKHNKNYRLFQTPMLNMLVMENAVTGEKLDDIDILAWMRAQSPVGNIDIVSKPIIRVHPKKCTSIDTDSNALAQPRLQPALPRTQVSSRALYDTLRLDETSSHVIWDSSVIFELERLVLSGRSLSSLDHPHAAEDVALSLQQMQNMDLTKASVAVVSSTVSPWVEFLLKSSGVSHVTSIDYNEPIICGINWIEPKSVTSFETEKGQYNLIVSYEGFESFGLGKFGDLIKEDKDMETIKRMHEALLPGGYLLLAIPTSAEAYTSDHLYRVYNIHRLAELLRFRFQFVTRVWDGQVLKGWNHVDETPKLFPHPDELDVPDWKHRHVLVLRKE